MSKQRVTKIGEEVRLRPDRFPSDAKNISINEKIAAKFKVIEYKENLQRVTISMPAEWGGGKPEGYSEEIIIQSVKEEDKNLIPANPLFGAGEKVQLTDEYFKDKNLIVAASKDEEFRVLDYYSDFSDVSKAGMYILDVPHNRGGHTAHKVSRAFGVLLPEKYLQHPKRAVQKALEMKANDSSDLQKEISEKIKNLSEENETLNIKLTTLLEVLKEKNTSVPETLTQLESQKQETSNKENLTMTSENSAKWMSRATEAGVRTGVKKFQQITRTAIGDYLSEYLKKDKTVSRTPKQIKAIVEGVNIALQTPMGEAAFCMLLGMLLEKGLTYGKDKKFLSDDPGDKVVFYLEQIEEELSVSGISIALSTAIDFAGSCLPTIQNVVSFLPDLTPEEIKVQETVTVAAARS